jgi:hypothetical protein
LRSSRILARQRLGLLAEQPHELEMVPRSLKIKVFEVLRSPVAATPWADRSFLSLILTPAATAADLDGLVS